MLSSFPIGPVTSSTSPLDANRPHNHPVTALREADSQNENCCKNGNAVQGPTRRHDAVRRPPTPGWLEADEPIEGGRHPARASRVGAECKGDDGPLYRHGRTTATATGGEDAFDYRRGVLRNVGVFRTARSEATDTGSIMPRWPASGRLAPPDLLRWALLPRRLQSEQSPETRSSWTRR